MLSHLVRQRSPTLPAPGTWGEVRPPRVWARRPSLGMWGAWPGRRRVARQTVWCGWSWPSSTPLAMGCKPSCGRGLREAGCFPGVPRDPEGLSATHWTYRSVLGSHSGQLQLTRTERRLASEGQSQDSHHGLSGPRPEPSLWVLERWPGPLASGDTLVGLHWVPRERLGAARHAGSCPRRGSPWCGPARIVFGVAVHQQSHADV